MHQSSATGLQGPIPAMPPRPARRLGTWAVLKAASRNSLSICDEELFDELVVSRRYLAQRVLFVSDPVGIKHILLDNFDHYPRLTPIRRLFEMELKTGSLASEGATWWRHRRVATPTLDPRAVAPDTPALIALAETVADQLDEHVGGAPIDLERWIGHLSTLLWNQVVTAGNPDTLAMLRWLSKIPRKPKLLDLVPKPRWLQPLLPRDRRRDEVADLDAQLRALIDERRAEGYSGPPDLLWRLAHSRDRESGSVLPREEVRDEAASLIAGGAAAVRALTWIWYLVALRPEVEDRMHAELDARLGGRPPLPEDLPELAYTRQVLEETMRLYPPIPAIMREASRADVVCGHRVPRGAMIAILPWIVHRHRKLWSDPDLFDPDRFTAEARAERPRGAYLPFATGPRVCVGASFAMTQMLVVIAVLARRFRFRLVPDHPIVPTGSISLQPSGGLQMHVERRR